MLAAHITRAPDPLISHRPNVPPALNAVLMRCLEKHPADRWQTAAELLERATKLLKGQPNKATGKPCPCSGAACPSQR